MRYRCIVADPPWDHSDGTGKNFGAAKWNKDTRFGVGHGEIRVTGLPYGVLSLEEIKALPVSELAQTDSHLYLWTTQRYLRASFDVAEAWGFRVVSTLVWCKKPKGFMGGAWRTSTEFIQFAKRGSLAHVEQAPQRWFTWPRKSHSVAAGESSSDGHSAKPDAFLDLVERVSPGPYLELFARRQRLGWDTWGDEALDHIKMDRLAGFLGHWGVTVSE